MALGDLKNDQAKSPLARSMPMASLDDAQTGSHKAFMSDKSTTVLWTLNGSFVRSFLLNGSSGSDNSGAADLAKGTPTAAVVEHIVFARFYTGDSSSDDLRDVALCIFRTDALNIHYYTGEAFTMALPFGVRSVHPLHTGLLVQRRCTASAESNLFAPSLPTIFSLLGPRSEFKMLGVSRSADMDRMRKQQQQQQRSAQFMLSPSPACAGSSDASIPIFNDPNITLVDAAASRRKGAVSQYILCWDSSARRYTIYQCVVIDPVLDGDDLAAATATATSTVPSDFDFDMDVDPSSNPPNAGSLGIGHFSAPRNGSGRQASLSVQRRSSAAVSAVAIAAAASRRKSGYSSVVKNDRRSSILGRVSFNDSPGPNFAVDIFREQRQMRAEAVLHPCWKERRQRNDVRSATAPKAQICVIQSYSGSDIVCILIAEAGQVIGLDTCDFGEVFRHAAQSIAPMRSTRRELDDLLILTPTGRLALALGSGGNSDPVPLDHLAHQGNIATIEYTVGKQVTISLDAQQDAPSTAVVSAHVRLSLFATATMDALSAVLSKHSGLQLRRNIIASCLGAKTAQEEMCRLTALLIYGSDGCHPAVSLPQRVKTEISDRSAAVLFALHLVYEDAALHKAETQPRLAAVSSLLLQFARQHALASQYHAYICEGFVPGEPAAADLTQDRQKTHNALSIIPSFFKWVISITSGNNDLPIAPFPMFNAVGQLFGIVDAEPVSAGCDSLKLLHTVAGIFFHLAILRRPTVAALEQLASEEAPLQLLLQLTPEMQWLLCATIEQTREVCALSWPQSVLKLLGREDLIANAAADFEPSSAPFLLKRRLPLGEVVVSDAMDGGETHGVVELSEEAVGHSAKQLLGTSTGAAHEFSQIAFSHDLRVDEAERMLDIFATVHAHRPAAESTFPEAIDAAKAQFMDLLARRVHALPLGRAAFSYSSLGLNSQDALQIDPPRVAARFYGNKLETVWTAPADTDTSWPLFHSGVLAALSIERSQLKGAHPSWVLLNWPMEQPTDADPVAVGESQRKYKDSLASHAGFLFGIGLFPDDAASSASGSRARQRKANGPLCDVPPWQAFKYLSIRHGLTSIALLMGCACAQRGTMNASVSKILSLHIPTLLPPGSSELMLLSHGTQAAAMLGLGLLYMNSQHRRMSEVMLGELFAIKNATLSTMTTRLDGADPAESAAECYSLAAGFALGLVALGQGTSSRSLSDLRLLDALTEVMHASDGNKAAKHESPMDMLGRLNIAPRSSRSLGSGGNVGNVSDLGAIAALGLVFLGTNYRPAAQRLALPTTTHEIQSIDPFLLLWKTLMHSLIMLDSISPTPAWVETNAPQWMPAQLPADLCRARLHVVTAACFAIGLKYAGTEDCSAHTTILTYFGEVEAAASRPALGYEPSLTRASAQACLDIMCISAALVMAGSGDVATMQRLRAFHGVSASRTYGTHMASNLALGILFIGGGARFTLSNSVESIALLLIAFFPRFPQYYSDNREHLQAWRHLWAICVKPRCLVARDVTSGRMCLEATISLVSRDASGESRTLSLVSPVLFPSLDRVASVHVWAPGYLPITLDLEINPDVGHLLSRRRIIYMQPSEHFPSLGTALGGMGLTSLSKYHAWLANVQCLVAGTCEQLEAAVTAGPESGEHSQTLAFSAIQAIQRLRICARYSRSCLTSRNLYSGDSAARNWAEATYLAWLATRDTVLRLGRLDACRQMIAVHWAAGQISPDASRSSRLFAVVGLMNAALDIPSPADAMELAKVVPASSLVDHFLGVK